MAKRTLYVPLISLSRYDIEYALNDILENDSSEDDEVLLPKITKKDVESIAEEVRRNLAEREVFWEIFDEAVTEVVDNYFN